eukprot:s163_g32.t1
MTPFEPLKYRLLTEIQLNKNYNARLHVDKNNSGPSWIVALGEFSGGELWVYDPDVPEKECVRLRLTAPLRGYAHLKVGQMLPGRAHCIKNRWLRFDGRCPHAALGFEGTRMSLVYFSRHLADDFLRLAATSLPHSDGGAATPCPSAEDCADSSDDDEEDDYRAGAAYGAGGLSLPRDFSEVFLHALEAAPPTHQTEIGVSSLHAGIAAPMSLHPLGFKTEVTIAGEDTAIRLAKGFKVAKATKDLDSFIKGQGLCEVRHKQADLKPPHERRGSTPKYCYNEERGFSTSKDTAAFRKVEAYLAERRPCLALVEIHDFDHLVLTLNRRAIGGAPGSRRLAAIEGYEVHIAQVYARDFGLPLGSTLLHVFAARKDILPPARLGDVATVARALGARLPPCKAQDYMVGDQDKDLQELQRKLWARGGSTAPVASPYMDFLLKSALGSIRVLAVEKRMDVASLLIDLCPEGGLKKLRESDVTDNGHLPNAASRAYRDLGHGAITDTDLLGLIDSEARDGNCLFRSFSDQVYGCPDYHALLRDRCTKYIASERSYFEQFVAEPFEEFLARIQREGEWGDDVEIEALSEIYDCRVEIYVSYGHSLMRTFHEACDAKWSQPVRLLYEGHAHYNSLAPRSGLCPIAQQLRPGEMEDAAISRSRRRHEAGYRRQGVHEADAKLTEQEVVDESIRLSRLEFEHKSDAEMDMALQDSRAEWEKSERKRMEEEVVDAILQQSVLEEEQKQLTLAMKESKEDVIHNRPEFAALYGMVTPAEPVPGASSSSAYEEKRDSREFQYPESVYAVGG